MTDDERMQETMDEIEGNTVSRKDSLRQDILDLESKIHSAQDKPVLNTVSPEQANQTHKDLVFLKKNLVGKKSELEQLGY